MKVPQAVMTIQSAKQCFLEREARIHCLEDALQRNPGRIYVQSTDPSRRDFRKDFARELEDLAERYRKGIGENEHNCIIESIASRLSEKHGDILQNGRLRIGTVQKALNLYLKVMWCLDSDWPTPPHCPIDSRILKDANIKGNWTDLDSLLTYKEWISKLRVYATSKGYSSIAEWELYTWNDFYP